MVGYGAGSGSYRYFGNVKLYKQGKKCFKIRGFTHFQVNFSFFSDKNNHSNIRRNMSDVRKKNLMFELILVSASRIRDPDPILKF